MDLQVAKIFGFIISSAIRCYFSTASTCANAYDVTGKYVGD
jgi:hypothetical protein